MPNLKVLAIVLCLSCVSGLRLHNLNNPRALRRSRLSMSTEVSKKEQRKQIMSKDDFMRSPQEFKSEKQVVDAMMLAEFKASNIFPFFP